MATQIDPIVLFFVLGLGAGILKADHERWGEVIRASGFKPGQ